MFAIRAEHGELKYGVYDLIYDTMDDFNKKTPHSGVQAGSTAFIIASLHETHYEYAKYMLNNKGKWIEISVGNSSSGGGGSTGGDDYDEVIYDGGNMDNPDE